MAAHSALGTLQYTDTAATAFTDIGEIIKFGGPKVKVNPVKTTHLASANQAHEYIAGFADGGEVAATINFKRADSTTLYGFYRTNKTMRVRYNDTTTLTGATTGSKWDFTAFWTEFGDETPEDDRITTTVNWKISGKPSFTAGSG